MSVPGVNVQTAATFMAAVGDVHRFSTPRKLVSYLGLDPRVRQSGNAPDRHGRLSTAAASKARHMLGQAAWKVTPPQGRCARSSNVSAPVAGRRSPRPRPRASSSFSSGTAAKPKLPTSTGARQARRKVVRA